MDAYTYVYNLVSPFETAYIGHYPTDQAGVPKVYPYAEINFPNITTNNTWSDKNLLTIDLWDNKDTDIRTIEALARSLNKILHMNHYNDVDMDILIFKDTPFQLPIVDPGLYIQRIQLRYLARIYYKN